MAEQELADNTEAMAAVMAASEVAGDIDMMTSDRRKALIRRLALTASQQISALPVVTLLERWPLPI